MPTSSEMARRTAAGCGKQKDTAAAAGPERRVRQELRDTDSLGIGGDDFEHRFDGQGYSELVRVEACEGQQEKEGCGRRTEAEGRSKPPPTEAARDESRPSRLNEWMYDSISGSQLKASKKRSRSSSLPPLSTNTVPPAARHLSPPMHFGFARSSRASLAPLHAD